ncbi:MAG TPA: histidine kinase dimerization/phospho-acceptor domain-containing protein, partial [Burkholderiaceae bacterium]
MNRAHALWLALIMVWVGLGPQPCLAQPDGKADDAWQVVILHNADYFLPASVSMDQALRETMLQGSKRPIEFFAESLDSLRFPATIDAELAALMRKKYVGKRVDLVLARASGGFAFAQRHRDELWPGAPIVLYNTLADQTPRGPAKANVTGILIDLDPAGTVELARRLQPDATQLFVIGGTAEYDRRWKARLQPILARLPSRIIVTWLDELPYEAIAPRLRQLAPNAIVLFTSMVRDTAGRSRSSPRTAHEIAEASAAPVYGFIDTYMGQGVVGGALTDFAAQGRAAGQLALRVLAGEHPDLIPIQESPPARCVVDARALQHFGIATDLLPKDCEVRYRSPSFWHDYWAYVLIGAAALVVQTGLIVALLVQRRRRQAAERDAQYKHAGLAQAARLAVVGELTASISHEMNQPLGAILSNIDAAEMALAAHPPDLAELRLIHSDIRRGGSRAAEVIRRIRGLLGKRDIERAPTDIN